MDFADRVAVVTGGTGALGRSVVKDLLAAGARVAVSYIIEDEWQDRDSQVKVPSDQLWGVKVDLGQPSEVETFVRDVAKRWGRLDFLLAIAGGFAPGKSYETDAGTWEHMLSMNLASLVNSLRAAVPIMIRQNFGRIVTISSGAILRGGGAGIAAYAVSKGAVRQLSEILADELKSYDIHVHCLMPGTMDTPANRRSMPKADFSTWVKTEEVARVIHFLLSDGARAVRSVTLPVLG